jgi:putative endonuclease
MYYLYVLRIQLDGGLNTGYTGNLKNRLKQHQNGEVTSTKPRRPLELIFYEEYRNQVDAKRRERYFKTTRGKSSLRLMLRDSLK